MGQPPGSERPRRGRGALGDSLLAVSDCAYRRLLLKSVFERHRSLVFLASNAQRAHDLLDVVQPDVIVSDLELAPPEAFVSVGPVDRFLERNVARKLEALHVPPQLGSLLVAKTLAFGFRLYLPSPIDLRLLRTTINRMVELDDEPVLTALLRR